MAGKGMVEELWITWRPRIIGGKRAGTITGLGKGFLPRGIALKLLKIERIGEECRARYRIRPSDR
jgi:riboflavin biosynthesis pyrimidine reductase